MCPNLSKRDNIEFRRLIRLIKKTYPPAFPVKIITKTKLKGNCFGYSTLIKEGSKSYFLIHLKRQPLSEMLEVAAHEFGHVLNFNFSHWQNRNDDYIEYHDEPWGCWYAKCYRLCFPANELSKCQL